jgi:hypothetical protein
MCSTTPDNTDEASLAAHRRKQSSVNLDVQRNWEFGTRCQDFIFKYGDDLRIDQACLQIFRLMNHVWSKLNLKFGKEKKKKVCTRVYCVTAMNSHMGLVEYIPDCFPLSKLTKAMAYKFTAEVVDQMVASSAASFIASYVLGIRDRHSDNILIAPDGTVFHIDFGHVLGRGVSIDTGPFALTQTFHECLVAWHKWEKFMDLCEQAFWALRKDADEVADYASLLLSPLSPDVDVKAYVKEALMCDKDFLPACQSLRQMISAAPTNFNTRLKNNIHQMALLVKS